MHCAHCLRGEAENKNISQQTLENLIKNTESIYSITFTGGEPSLNTTAIANTLALCKEYKIPVYSFYIVTNGKKVSEKFLSTCINWYAYCLENGGEPESSGIALSKDNFHQDIDPVNELKLKALSFFRNDKMTDFTKYYLIESGRAKNLTQSYRTRPLPNSKIYADINESTKTIFIQDESAITTDGDLLPQCDYEFADTNNIKVGNINNPQQLIKNIMCINSET
jgi:organic radical activating enzyme